MTNLNHPGLGFDPNHGKSQLNRQLKGVAGRLKGISRSRPFVAFAALVVVLLGLYYFVLAAPLYVSKTSFSLRSREQQPAAAMATANLLSTLGQPNTAAMETAEVSEFIRSYDMLEKLDRRFNLRKLYSQPRLDFLHWMPANARREDFLNFYRKMVIVRIERETNIVRVEVRSFDPKSAHAIADAVLELTADYVDGLSDAIRRDTVRTSELELKKAQDAVRDARLAMTRYRTQAGMVDPQISAATATGNINAMRQQVIEARSQLAALLTYSTPNAPQVVQLRARVAALEAQIADAQQRLATTSREDTLAQHIYEYEGLLVANEYAEKQLVAALAAYDTARAVASQREKFLVRIVNPNLPDRPTLPRRLLSFFEALLVAIAAYGIIALAIAGIRDHQGI